VGNCPPLPLPLSYATIESVDDQQPRLSTARVAAALLCASISSVHHPCSAQFVRATLAGRPLLSAVNTAVNAAALSITPATLDTRRCYTVTCTYVQTTGSHRSLCWQHLALSVDMVKCSGQSTMTFTRWLHLAFDCPCDGQWGMTASRTRFIGFSGYLYIISHSEIKASLFFVFYIELSWARFNVPPNTL